MRHIQYAFSVDEECLVSRVGNEIAWPVLDYKAIGKGGNYNAPLKYDMEKFSVSSIGGRNWDALVWTRFVPTELKNQQRKFWNMAPLPPERRTTCPRELCKAHKVNFFFSGEDELTVAVFHGIYGYNKNCRGPRGLYHWFRFRNQDELMGYDWFGISTELKDGFKKQRIEKL